MKGVRYLRNVIRIRAEDSPNVDLALRQKQAGIEPTGEMVLEGVLPYHKYVERRQRWSPERQTIGLDGKFFEDAAELLWPAEWLTHSERLAAERPRHRQGKAMGVDPGEGKANTCWTIGDDYGVIYQESMLTRNTAVIIGKTKSLGSRFGVPPEDWLFDRGGGGLQHVDRLRDAGFDARTVGFGERPTMEVLVAGSHFAEERVAHKELVYDYKTLRIQMYFEASITCDPQYGGYGIPVQYTELHRQLSLMPRLTDEEGRPKMLPKGTGSRDEKRPTLYKLLGCSPDEADSFVLMNHARLHKESGALVEAG